MELVCSLTVLGDLPVLQASGEIDLATLPYFHDQLNRAISLHVGAEGFVDLDGVTALDDTGIGMLLGAAGRAREHGGDLLLVVGLLLLCVEVYRATSSSSAAILNHVLSLVVFIIALIELLVMPRMANMTFFLIVLMTLSAVIAGFTVTISTARRDIQRPS